MKAIYKALADFQQEVPAIHKGTEGYGYSYSNLAEIYEVINPLLKKHGLGFTQLIEGDTIKTILFHVESGETIESTTNIPQNVSLAKMNQFQVLGSAITYIRRYAISAMLGIITDKDTDAAGQQVATVKEPETWLNVDSDQWKALEASLAQGTSFSLSQIRKKYKVSKDVATELSKLGVS